MLSSIPVVKCLAALILGTVGTAVAVVAQTPPPDARPVRADELFQAAERSQAGGDSVNALLLYAQATDLDPGNPLYNERLSAMQAIVNARATAQINDPVRARNRELSQDLAQGVPLSDLYGGADALGVPTLRDPGERHSFELRATPRLLYEQVAREYGLVPTFEPDFPAQGAVDYRVNNATMVEALRVVEAVTNSFIVPSGPRGFMVYRDTTQNRTDHEPVVAAVVPVPERISLQEAQEMAAGIQQTMEIRRIAVDGPRRVIYMRDEESKILAARKILSDLSRPRPQVMVEVELLSALWSSSLMYGMSLPTSAPIVYFGDFLNNTPIIPSGFNNYATFGGGQSFFGLGIADAAAFATLSRSSARSLLKTQMLALSGQEAALNIGSRFPVVVGRFGDPSNPALSTPQTQYIDLGLKITVTPTVHEDGDVTLDIEADYNALTGASNDGIPVVGRRTFQGASRVADGHWAVIAGLLQSQVNNTWDGWPVISQIPILGKLFRDNRPTRDNNEFLIVLKTYIVNSGPWEQPTIPVWTGSETKPPTQF